MSSPNLDLDTLPTVVVFGTTGHGKSSVINMLTNHPNYPKTAKASLSAVGVTTIQESQEPYIKDIKGKYIRMFDCPGVGDPPSGTVPSDIAVRTFYGVLISQRKIHLIVHVVRSGRLTETEGTTHALIRLLIGPDLPIAIVFTHGDKNGETDDERWGWWENQAEELKARFPAAHHICVTASEGYDNPERQRQYAASRVRLNDLLSGAVATKGWKVPVRTPSKEVAHGFFSSMSIRLRGRVSSEKQFQHDVQQHLIAYGLGGRAAKEATLALMAQKPHEILTLPPRQPVSSPIPTPLPVPVHPSVALRRGKHPGSPPTIVLVTTIRRWAHGIMKMLDITPGPEDDFDPMSLTPYVRRQLISSREYDVIAAPYLDWGTQRISALCSILLSRPRIDLVIFVKEVGRFSTQDDFFYHLLQKLCKGLVPITLATVNMENLDSPDPDAYKHWWETESGASGTYTFDGNVGLVTKSTDPRYQDSAASLAKMISDTASPGGYTFLQRKWVPTPGRDKGLSERETEFYESLDPTYNGKEACLEIVKSVELAADVLEGKY